MTDADQPRADAVCAVCQHPGADHISLGGLPSRCRCGCDEREDEDDLPVVKPFFSPERLAALMDAAADGAVFRIKLESGR